MAVGRLSSHELSAITKRLAAAEARASAAEARASAAEACRREAQQELAHLQKALDEDQVSRNGQMSLIYVPAADDGKAQLLAERNSLQQQLAQQRQAHEGKLDAAHRRTMELEEALATARLGSLRDSGDGELAELAAENRNLKRQLEQTRRLIEEHTGFIEKDWMALWKELEGVRQRTKPCARDTGCIGKQPGTSLVAPAT